VHRADLTTLMCRLSWNLLALTSWNPQGLFYLFIVRQSDPSSRGDLPGVFVHVRVLWCINNPIHLEWAERLEGKGEGKGTPNRTKSSEREGRNISLSFFDLGTRMGGWSASRSGCFTPINTRYQLYRRLGVLQGRSGRVRKISPPTRNRSPDRPACSQSLYRLSYPGP
jgi:hypothetical protein